MKPRTWAALVHDTISSTSRTVRALALLAGVWVLASGSRLPAGDMVEVISRLLHR